MEPELTRVGQYEILDRIGQGAMGVLYRGRDPVLDREVAIKVMAADFLAEGGEGARERFFREAKAAAKLQHRNIVTIFEYGEEAGLSFIVMEYLRGRNLATRMKESPPLTLEAKLDIGTELCTGLEFAHRNDVVHRDIKPANIWLGEDGTVKLLDFGIARMSSATLSNSSELLGTVSYMAPEQISGKPVDGRADVFSAAVVLYELIADRKPFHAESPAGTIHRVLHEPAAALETLVPGLPAALSAVVAKALSKKPDERFQTAADLAVELQNIRLALRPVGETVILPRPPSSTIPTAVEKPPAARTIMKSSESRGVGILPPISDRSWLAFGITAAVLILMGIAGGYAWSRRAVTTAPPARSAPVPNPAPTPPPPPPRSVALSLRVHSTPSDASIRIDGRETGLVTPAIVALPDSNTHKIEVVKPGFLRAESRPTPSDFERGVLTFTLTPERQEPKSVKLIVKAPPDSVYPFEVWDGPTLLSPENTAHELTVKPTPTIRLVQKKVYLNWPLPKNWMQGGPLSPPALGRLRVEVLPGSALQKCPVYVDGLLFGEPGDTKAVVSGDHVIELKCDGAVGISANIPVQVKNGEIPTVKKVG